MTWRFKVKIIVVVSVNACECPLNSVLFLSLTKYKQIDKYDSGYVSLVAVALTEIWEQYL